MATAGHIPLRTCVACGRRAPQRRLLRLAVSRGRVAADPGRRLQGRGAYLCPAPECRERLAGQRNKSRHFRRRLPEGAWRELMAELGASGPSREPGRGRGDS
jgi:hypothetical protein